MVSRPIGAQHNYLLIQRSLFLFKTAFQHNVLEYFDLLLTVHLSIFILVINQLDAQNLFYNKFISCVYMFRAPCAHRQDVKIVRVHGTVTYRV